MTTSGTFDIMQSMIEIEITDKNTGRTLSVEVSAQTLVAALQKQNASARHAACDEICRAYGEQLREVYEEEPHLLNWSDIEGSIIADLSLRQLPLALVFEESAEAPPCLFDHLVPSVA